jgi:hypothetical protein
MMIVIVILLTSADCSPQHRKVYTCYPEPARHWMASQLVDMTRMFRSYRPGPHIRS